MQEVFEKITEKLKSEKEQSLGEYNLGKYNLDNGIGNKIAENYRQDMYEGRCFAFDDAIEIVKQEAENFGTDINVGSNGWIPSSESIPCESGYYLVTYHEWSNGDYLPKYDDTYVRRLHYQRSEHFVGWNYPHCVDEMAEADTNREVIAWMNLPAPYQPKGE